MTTVSSTSNTSAGTSSASKSAASSSADIQDRFLNLLVAQISNQDPLNPMDNAQLTSQLAQISTVTGIEGVNTTLSSLVNSLGEAQAMQSADMIGKAVLVPGKNLTLTKGAAYAGVKLEGDADQVTVTIKDAKGKVIATETLGEQKAGNVSFSWDGKTNDGTTAADGDYTFTVAAVRGSDKVTAEALQYGTVSAVTRASDGFALDLGALGSFKFSDVQQVL
jgi:flagellar basal-body rod modification protein FlgD